MHSLPLNINAADLPNSARALRQRQLLDLLISDAANDVEVVARELGLGDQMRERLRRALDRMACAQSVLESIGPDGAEAGIDGSAAGLRMREAVGLLAKEWPAEYPAHAAEWMLMGELGEWLERAEKQACFQHALGPSPCGGLPAAQRH
ncbi:hypothetical protein PQQ81_31860 [Paraburkholderia strydomiana]|uniref:hypothetical protein n=1 Tax=Paraburkholderia strydomiana TaxID=1245417 RepID=UPI0038BC8AA1